MNPYRNAREMVERSCPPDVKAQIHEVTDKWKDIRPGPIMPYDEMRVSIERQARAWAFWLGVLCGVLFSAGVLYLLKGLVGG